MTNLDRLERDFAGLADYHQALATYFGVDPTTYRSRIEQGLESHAYETLAKGCKRWQAVGILPDLEVKTDAQVGEVWTNLVFQVFLDAGLDFSPPAEADLAAELAPALMDFSDLRQRRNQRLLELKGGAPYWRSVIGFHAHELYLEPFLLGGSLLGCDLACGWGRASLTMTNWRDRRVLGIDLSEAGLTRYRELAERRGVGGQVDTRVGSLEALPLDDASVDFFFAFDIFEHMTDELLARVLREILRCAKDCAVLYAEIPLLAFCPPLTHLQNFTIESVVERFHATEAHGRTFRVLQYHPEVSDQFTFWMGPTSLLGG
ncbi:MAG: class I SAM-dependent methyltransferase [Vulcanimicrobiota bacterium]